MTRIFKNPKIHDQALGFEFVFLIPPQKGAKSTKGKFQGLQIQCVTMKKKSNLRFFSRPSFLSLDIICYLRFDICFLRFIIVGLP